MPSKVIIIVIEFMLLGINMFWALLSLAARAKMSLSRAQNIFMPANINSIVILPCHVTLRDVTLTSELSNNLFTRTPLNELE